VIFFWRNSILRREGMKILNAFRRRVTNWIAIDNLSGYCIENSLSIDSLKTKKPLHCMDSLHLHKHVIMSRLECNSELNHSFCLAVAEIHFFRWGRAKPPKFPTKLSNFRHTPPFGLEKTVFSPLLDQNFRLIFLGEHRNSVPAGSPIFQSSCSGRN
jgi:hypothetical protein